MGQECHGQTGLRDRTGRRLTVRSAASGWAHRWPSTIPSARERDWSTRRRQGNLITLRLIVT